MSSAQFLVGVLFAIVVFVAQEIIRDFAAAVRFRRRLCIEIKIVRDDLRKFIPHCQKLLNGAEKDDGVMLPPIWAHSFDEMQDVMRNASYLHTGLLPHVYEFFDTCGRFDEMRRTHNDKLIELGTSGKKLDGDVVIPVMLGLFADLLKVARRITELGDDVLSRMRDRYGWDDELAQITRPFDDDEALKNGR